jgi:hypothetical protein
MKPRTLTYSILAVVLGIFLLANLHLLSLPIQLNLLFTQVQAPLGVFTLVVVALIALIDLGSHTLARRSWQQDRRNLVRQVEELRGRADDTEAARLVRLETLMQSEFSAIRAQIDRAAVAAADTGSPFVSQLAPPTERGALRQV